jgi:hypothetical protein
LSFHRTGPRCPTSVYVHDDDDGLILIFVLSGTPFDGAYQLLKVAMTDLQ